MNTSLFGEAYARSIIDFIFIILAVYSTIGNVVFIYISEKAVKISMEVVEIRAEQEKINSDTKALFEEFNRLKAENDRLKKLLEG